MLRVTSNTFPNALVDQLGQLMARQNRYQQQVATGQRVRLPEDDPVAMQRGLELQAQGASLTQYQANIAAVKDRANASYQAARDLKTISDRARELATMADGTRSPEELAGYSAELAQLIQQGVQTANQKFDGQYLLSGTATDQPPFALTLDANGRVATVSYQGNQSVAQVEIAQGVTAAAQTLGANTTGAGPRGLITDSRTGADFFNHLIQLQNHLAAGDTAAVTQDQPSLATDEDNLLYHFANLGATIQRLDATANSASQSAAAVNATLSSTVDADLPETLVRLNETQTAYQAALQSGARIMGQSLLDYLT
jgi:flagellar hook-associated protein 3 FlgL